MRGARSLTEAAALTMQVPSLPIATEAKPRQALDRLPVEDVLMNHEGVAGAVLHHEVGLLEAVRHRRLPLLGQLFPKKVAQPVLFCAVRRDQDTPRQQALEPAIDTAFHGVPSGRSPRYSATV